MPYSSDDMIENEHKFNNHQANKRQGIPVSTLLITGINQIHFPTRVINRPCTRVPIILFWNVIGGAKKYPYEIWPNCDVSNKGVKN